MSINAARNNPLAVGDVGWRPSEVHPLADIFPMMTDDELADLAEDIKANGLLHPIVVDADGVLIDGRNRLAACERAGVEPRYQMINGHDPVALIVSANLNRRNMNKGQQAMALAMIYPEPGRGRGNKDGALKAAESAGFKERTLRNARSVLRHSRALAEDVLAHRTTLDKALVTVEEERRAGQSVDARMTELRVLAPDIADLVDDERISLEAGMTELRTRQRRTNEAIDAAKQAVARLVDIPTQVLVLEMGFSLGGDEVATGAEIEAVSKAVAGVLEVLDRIKAALSEGAAS